jgi:predicted O-methyltransferase YrrM
MAKEYKMKQKGFLTVFTIFLVVITLANTSLLCQNQVNTKELDKKVRSFLEDPRRSWRDMNVPNSDGELLYDLVLKNKYTKALEIGTSTGHSSIWIAWALSKTGGKLITIEIDEDRYEQAMANFKEAGLSEYIDARLADAHELVKELKGPFDFVFSDADKYWYTNYFKDVDPKLEIGGCFTAHNIRGRERGGGGTEEFWRYVNTLKNYDTSLDRRGGGVSISYKKSN